MEGWDEQARRAAINFDPTVESPPTGSRRSFRDRRRASGPSGAADVEAHVRPMKRRRDL
jgi:hypothetical protein